MEPARLEVGPIIINSGFRNARVNRLVGGVAGSQHLIGQAADIRPKDPSKFSALVDFLKKYYSKPITAFAKSRLQSLRLFLDVGEGVDEGGEEVGEAFGGVVVEVAGGAAHVAEHGRGVAVVDEDAVLVL